VHALYAAHSGLRYLILLAGIAHLVLCLAGIFGKKTPGKPNQILAVSFMGLIHTQVLLGLVMVVMGRYYPALMGHIFMMIPAAATATTFYSMNKRRPTPSYALALGGTLTTLLLIALGIMSIGRGLFTMTPFAG
jgi:heme A synthase